MVVASLCVVIVSDDNGVDDDVDVGDDVIVPSDVVILLGGEDS